MNYSIETFPPFDRAAKRLAKRYKSLKDDLSQLINELRANPQMGTDLGNGFRKIRMAVKSKGKGKSGGARIITFTLILSQEDTTIALLYLYDKSERSNITDKELEALMKECGL